LYPQNKESPHAQAPNPNGGKDSGVAAGVFNSSFANAGYVELATVAVAIPKDIELSMNSRRDLLDDDECGDVVRD